MTAPATQSPVIHPSTSQPSTIQPLALQSLTIQPGESFPLGATVREGGINFSLYAKDATAVELLLFDSPEAPWPNKTFGLDPKENKTFQYWHAFIPGLRAGQVYAYRVDGPYAPEQGLRFNRNKVLIDPYCRLVVGWHAYCRQAASTPFDNCNRALRSVVVDPSQYDWEGDVPPKTPYAETVIYEMHLGGFTQHPNSGLPAVKRGTYAGLIEKIPYLTSLGITAVELMPVQQFDVSDAPTGRVNYWGYSPVGFFAPHWNYSANKKGLGPVDEFRDMVKALHKAGIEVILDVVFNHTAEGDHQGPTLSFRGLCNESYYILEDDKARYKNYSGCGNTLKTSSINSYLILDCLRYWVLEMHVDGFRFDLASILSRGVTGEPLASPPLLWQINTDPALASIKIIAEAWDAAGLYQVGHFAGDRFAEWNGPYRDEVRRFVRGDGGLCGAIAHRIMGSPGLYPHLKRGPNYNINFVTCHDGFTLHDLVSYNHKHNDANGENSRDGANDNWSWNCGEEGPTDTPLVKALRIKQAKNMFVLWAMSQGTPMMLMGDEVLRSQRGNNNAYCQNNELSWFDWKSVSTQKDFLCFVQQLICFMQSLHIFKHDEPLTVTAFDAQEPRLEPLITWHGVSTGKPDWGEDSHSLSFTLRYQQHGELLHIIFNAFWEALTFELPQLTAPAHWHRIVDTSLTAPQDFCAVEQAPKIDQPAYAIAPRSAVILMADSPYG